MTSASALSDLAARVGDRLSRLPPPWEVYAERSRRFEIHLNGSKVELVRGPITLEGYGVRVLRVREAQTGVGYQSSTDVTPEGIRAVVADAEEVARFSQFPASHAELPGGRPTTSNGPQIIDPILWADPSRTLDNYVASLLSAFERVKGAVPSFGSVKVKLTEASMANSASLAYAYGHTAVEMEVAVKAFGGAGGRPPGEYWVTTEGRRLQPELLPNLTAEWARFAEDARSAKPPPNGELPVILPAEVLEGIVPPVLGFKFSAAASLRGLAVKSGSQVGADNLEIADDGTIDWGVGSSPVDDEGTPQRKRGLISSGRASELLFDVLHADALGATSTGSGLRLADFGPGGTAGHKFTHLPGPQRTTIVIPAGAGGTDAELVEQVDDGIWVQQIGWAQPEPLSGGFGGEIRIGYRIRGGKLAEPIRGGTVGGVVVAPEGAPSLLNGISASGSRPKLVGSLSSPTLLIRALSVSGQGERGPTSAP